MARFGARWMSPASNLTASRIVSQDIHLGADKTLTSERVLLGGERGWMRVIDGQLFTPDGETMPGVSAGGQNQPPVGRSKPATLPVDLSAPRAMKSAGFYPIAGL